MGEPDRTFARRAFLTLFLIMAAQSVTETARDAVFLSRLPFTQLPWMYLLVAIASILVSRTTTVLATYFRRSMLPTLLPGAAAISCAFWLASGLRSQPLLYLLYIWPGVFGSLAVVEFWRAVSDAYTITEAKMMFGRLGAGGTAGAACGSAVAMAMSLRFPASGLLLIAGVVMAVAAPVSGTLPSPAANSSGSRVIDAETSHVDFILSNRYLRGVAACLFLATMSATIIDFIFKGVVTRDLPSRNLATVFAATSFTVNASALALQTLFVGPLIRRLGVTRSMAVLPSALVIAAGALVGGTGLAGTIAARITDGTLRYSVHRAVSDLLYVPLAAGVRARIKSLIDVLSQRVGQVVASLAILAILALGGGYRSLAAAIAALSVTTIVIALRLTRPYLDLFRATLKKAGTETRLAVPELDVESLTSLVAAFSSADERTVVAAMDLAAAQRDVHIIPVVMLFHPSTTVVRRALELFEQHPREGIGWALDRLRDNAADPHIRIAALTACAVRQRDEPALRAMLDDRDPGIRMAAVGALVAGGWMDADSAAGTLVQLADSPDTTVRLRAAAAMARMPSQQLLPPLRAMLAESALRQPASDALEAIGRPALDFLAASLDDETLPRAIRLHLPRTISRFGAIDAAPLLWRRLFVERDDLIQSKILRAMDRLVTEAPDSRPDRSEVTRAIRHVCQTGLRFAVWRRSLESGTGRTETETLLIRLLADKQERAVQFIFRLLRLDNPTEDFERIYRGLHGSRVDRASGRELVETVLPRAEREIVLALADDSVDSIRIVARAAAGGIERTNPGETLTAIIAGTTGTVRRVALKRAEEIELLPVV